METIFNITPIGISANGIKVFEHPTSHIHIEKDLAAEVIGRITLDGGYHFETVDMGRVIGKDHLVEVSRYSPVFYAIRPYSYEPLKLRNGESRMTWNKANNTKFITIGLCVDTDPDELKGKWCIFTIFEGKPGEKELFDRAFENGANPELYEKCKKFWEGEGERKEHAHALACTEREREYYIQLAKSDNEFFKKLYAQTPRYIKEMIMDENLDERLGLKAKSCVSQMLSELRGEYESWERLEEDVIECCEEYYNNAASIEEYYLE